MSLENFDTAFAFAVVMLLLSLLTTTLVQLVIGASGMRGRNLVWGLTQMLANYPSLKTEAAKLAELVATHPAVAPFWRHRDWPILKWFKKRASAIGSDELITILQDLARDSNDSLSKEVKGKLKEAIQESVPPESLQHAKMLAAEFKRQFPEQAVRMDEVVARVTRRTSAMAAAVDTWFDMVMTRTTERFVLHTRWITVGFAAVLAFGLHVDSLRLFRDLSTDTELRTVLVKSSDQALQRAEQVLGTGSIATAAIESIRAEFGAQAGISVPAGIATREQGEAWLRSALAHSANLDKLIQRYHEAFDKTTRERLGQLGTQAIELRDQLERSRLIVIPDRMPALSEYWTDSRHLLGVVMSMFLLGLGAPFWYNLLSGLATLRPLLAGKVDPSKSEKPD